MTRPAAMINRTRFRPCLPDSAVHYEWASGMLRMLSGLMFSLIVAKPVYAGWFILASV
jgi:hypothetical protein